MTAASFSTALEQCERTTPLYAPMTLPQREPRPDRFTPTMENRTEDSQRRHQRRR
jgi:hypothetical protein